MLEFIQAGFSEITHYAIRCEVFFMNPTKVEPELDFGIVRTHDEKRTLPLNIINSGESARDAQIDWIRQMEQPKESFLKFSLHNMFKT